MRGYTTYDVEIMCVRPQPVKGDPKRMAGHVGGKNVVRMLARSDRQALRKVRKANPGCVVLGMKVNYFFPKGELDDVCEAVRMMGK